MKRNSKPKLKNVELLKKFLKQNSNSVKNKKNEHTRL